MCSGAILLYKIPKVIIGENKSFKGPEDYLKSRGVELIVLQNQECICLMETFMQSQPKVWAEDISV